MNDKCPAVMAGHLTRPSHMLAKYIYMLIPTDFARIYAVQALEGEKGVSGNIIVLFRL